MKRGCEEKKCLPNKKDTLSTKQKTSRYVYMSQSELESSKKKVVPQNTKTSMQWAIKTFTEWAESRKESGREAPPSNIMLMGSAEAVCDTLCLFFSEMQQANGNLYTLRSLSSIMAGLQRFV